MTTLNSDYYSIYKNSIFDLVATMKINSLCTANAINTYLIGVYGASAVNENDPTTWKYFMNMCGIAHEVDTPMFVNSLDNGVLIPFTVESLAVNPVTASSYIYGSNYYYNLLATYPTQERLIQGVLYPATMATAVTAKDGQILAYPSYLVEPNEETLMIDIQNWIYYYINRWYRTPYSLTDAYYNTYSLAIMYMFLVPKILNLRLARCKTREVHSYHVRQYLASHQGLDAYYDYLTLGQALWLYRNILYIERNAGSNQTLQTLISQILTPASIPLSEFTIKQQSIFDSNCKPSYTFIPTALNNVGVNVEAPSYNLAQILLKESTDGVGMADYIANQSYLVDDAIKNSASDSIETKLLISDMVDYTDSTPLPITNALLNHWMYMGSAGLYNGLVIFLDVLSGTSVSLCAQDAFIYLLYLTSVASGSTLPTIPQPVAMNVTKATLPTAAEITASVENTYAINPNIAEWIASNQPPLIDCESPTQFFTLVKQINQIQQQQLFIIANQNHHRVRAIVEMMCDYMYNHIQVTFYKTMVNTLGEIVLTTTPVTGMTYTEWLGSKSLPTGIITPAEANALITNITTSAFGYNPNNSLIVANIQQAMIGIMKTLSSYSVQFLSSINDSNIIPLNWAAIRIGDVGTTGSTLAIDDTYIGVQSVNGSTTIDVSVDLTQSPEMQFCTVEETSGSISQDVSVLASFSHDIRQYDIYSPIPIIKVTVDDPYQISGNVLSNLIVGYGLYASLTSTQQASLRYIGQNPVALS